MSQPQQLRIGPEHPDEYWDASDRAHPGDCPNCGGQCDLKQDCGIHPLGCIFGGSSQAFWMIADGCELFHGEDKPPPT